MAKMDVAFVEEAKKEIVLNVFEGTVSEETAVAQLTGLQTVVAIAMADSKSNQLKEELAPIKASIDGTINKLSGTTAAEPNVF